MLEKIDQDTFKSISPGSWAKLSGEKIFFGHQSTGTNIIDGIRDVMSEHRAVSFNIVETKHPSQLGSPIFAHAMIGKNYQPLVKIDDFQNLMDLGIGKRADVAFLKFCFVDIDAKTDVEALFHHYRKTMATLENKYPHMTFIHVTAPLMTVQQGPKAMVKKLLGKPLDGYADNAKRNQYNDLLRKEYSADRIYDLAEIESTLPDGSRSAYTYEGRTYYSLAHSYTNDGGHLNPAGRVRAAKRLLMLLTNQTKK